MKRMFLSYEIVSNFLALHVFGDFWKKRRRYLRAHLEIKIVASNVVRSILFYSYS